MKGKGITWFREIQVRCEGIMVIIRREILKYEYAPLEEATSYTCHRQFQGVLAHHFSQQLSSDGIHGVYGDTRVLAICFEARPSASSLTMSRSRGLSWILDAGSSNCSGAVCKEKKRTVHHAAR